jgi:hypothetical protein
MRQMQVTFAFHAKRFGQSVPKSGISGNFRAGRHAMARMQTGPPKRA